MATESQELQLIVTAVDNASAVLAKTKRELEDFGKHSKRVGEQAGSSIGEALKGIEKFGSKVVGLPLAEFARIAAEATRGIGGFTTALAAVPVALWEVNESLKEFGERMGNLKVHAESLGLMTGEFEALNQQIFKMTGNMQTAQQTTSNLITWIARAQRMGTPERANIGRMFQNPGEVLANLGRLSQLGPEEQVKGVINMLRASEERQRQNLMQGFGGRPGLPAQAAKTQAATFTEDIARGIGLPADWREIDASKLHAATQKQIEDAKVREEAAKDVKQTEGDLAVALEKWKDKILIEILPGMDLFLKGLTGFVDEDPFGALIASMLALAGGGWAALKTLQATVKFLGLGGAGAGGAAAAGGEAAAGAAGGLTAGGMIGAAAALALEEITRGEFKEGRSEAAQKAADPDLFKRQLEDAQKGILPGDAGATVPKFQHGGIVRRPMMGLLGEAGPEAVIPLSAMGAQDASREQQKLLRENTEELRRLNDFLLRPEQRSAARAAGGTVSSAAAMGMGAGADAIRLGGGGAGGGGGPGGALGGLIGGLMGGGGGGGGGLLGRMGGLAGGGGGGLGGIMRSITGGGMGGLPGLGRPGGGGGGGGGGGDVTPSGQPAARPPGIQGDPSVPSNILATAQHVALQGGPGAVAQFMKDQGYPKNGNWCGEFAASVVKASGYTPPAGAAVASNWRKFGTAVEGAPQPGDIAVRRGTPTGQTGSHVTFVENYDPKTGTFTGLGGNQRAGPESRFKAGGYEFRRPGAGMAEAGGAGGGGGGAGGGAGGNDAIANERARVMRQLQEPGMRDLTARVISHEQAGGAGRADVLESLVNRSVVTGKHPRDLINSGFYGPVNRGEIGSKAPDWALKDYDAAAAAVGAGRNELGGRTDQGMLKEVKPGGREGIRGEFYGWMGLPGEQKTAAARLARDGSALDQTHRVEGHANIDVNVNAPPGTNVRARAAGLFKQTRLTRQTQMPLAAGGPAGPASIA